MSREARAARREAYWNRPKHPHDWRYWVGGTGRVLIVIGLLMFGFVAYQLWGTGLQYAQAQNRLDDDLEELFAEAGVSPAAATPAGTAAGPTTVAPTTPPATDSAAPSSPPSPSTSTTAPATTTTASSAATSATVPVPVLAEGQGFAWLDIPALGLDDIVVVAGVRPSSLEDGPGHYPGTPMPGQLGNAAIAGHRTTYGQPFFRLDELVPGDEIIVTTLQGTFVYLVTGSEIVPPDRGDVVLTTDPDVARLTLTTCDPKYTATNRLIVRADLDPTAGTPAQPPDLSYGPGVEPDPAAAPPDAAAPATLPGEDATVPTGGSTPGATGPDATTPGVATSGAGPTPTGPSASDRDPALDGPTPADVEDAFALGWFSDSAAWPHVIGWGLLTAGVAALGYLVARLLRRRWVGWVGAAVPFAVTLYFFYENVNRLLPPAL